MVDRLVQYHRLLVGAIAALGLLSGIMLIYPGMVEDYRLEAFVASNDPSYQQYRRFLDEFPSNEFAAVAVQTDDALSPETRALVRDIRQQVIELPAVERADTITDISPLALQLVGERLRTHRLIVDNLLSRDGRTAAMLLQMRGEGQTAANRRETVGRLKQIVADAQEKYPQARIILAGPYVTIIDMYEYVDRDLVVFSVAAFVLITATMTLIFRRAGPMLLGAFTALTATVFTLAIAIVAGFSTSLITQMIVTLLLVLSVASCVHLAVASDDVAAMHPQANQAERARRTLSRMIGPCVAVTLTTAVGFGSVCISQISPVRTFGLLMVCGLSFSLLAALAATPMLNRPKRKASSIDPGTAAAPQSRTTPGWLSHALTRTALWANRRSWTVVLLFVGFSVLAASAFGRLRFESDFVKNFRPESEVRQSYQFIESNLSPVGSVEIVVRSEDGSSVVTPDAIARARRLGDAVVQKHEPIRKAMTIADLTTLLTDRLPTNQIDLDARLQMARSIFGEDLEMNFRNADGSALRINLRALEGVNVHDKLAMSADIEAMARAEFGPGFRVQVTGLYHFYAKLVSGLLRDQYRSFGLTVPLVYLVLALMFRSFAVGAVAMVPNVVPILFCLGAMGWAEIPVNMTTAMMLSVTLGIAVDDTVHYLWRYRDELARTGDHEAALIATSGGVGRACVFTTVVIAGGFWILTLSEFLPTAYFGGLVGFTMLGTLAADLLLLPVLLKRFRVFGVK